MKLYQENYKNGLMHLGLAEESRTILYEDLPLSEYEPVVAEEVVIFRFLLSTLIWLDIISSITVGTTPYLLTCHPFVMAPDSQIKLENIMGCENWAMLQIGRIAALHERKTQALQQGCSDCTKCDEIVGDISRKIQCGLTQGTLEDLNISQSNSAKMSGMVSKQPTLITNLFAYMASLYLHLVTHGFQKLEILDTTISEAMQILQTQIPVDLLPALVSPIYVIGSVARQGDKEFFRKVFSSPPLLHPLFKHRDRILPILEEIWRRRETPPGFAWKDSLELASDILLL